MTKICAPLVSGAGAEYRNEVKRYAYQHDDKESYRYRPVGQTIYRRRKIQRSGFDVHSVGACKTIDLDLHECAKGPVDGHKHQNGFPDNSVQQFTFEEERKCRDIQIE